MRKNTGILYALKNELWGTNLKIGLTTQKIEKRISTLQTSLFIDCEIISTTNQLINCKIYEFLLKKILKEYRVRNDREFFNIDLETMKEIYESFNHINTILNTEEKLNNYIMNNHPEYYNKKKETSSSNKKRKGLFVDTSNL